ELDLDVGPARRGDERPHDVALRLALAPAHAGEVAARSPAHAEAERAVAGHVARETVAAERGPGAGEGLLAAQVGVEAERAAGRQAELAAAGAADEPVADRDPGPVVDAERRPGGGRAGAEAGEREGP